jgi:hypothetical protein
MTGRWKESAELIRKRFPEAFAETPEVRIDWACDAGGMAMLREQLGDPRGARRLAEAALATWERSPLLRNPYDLVCRARLLVAAGRRDDATEAFRRAVDAGYRDLTADGVVSLRDEPVLRTLNGDPRYEAQWKRIEEDLARQRADYEAGTKKAAGA